MVNSANIVLCIKGEYKGSRAEKKIEEMTENIPNLINEIKPQTLEAVGIK